MIQFVFANSIILNYLAGGPSYTSLLLFWALRRRNMIFIQPMWISKEHAQAMPYERDFKTHLYLWF